MKLLIVLGLFLVAVSAAEDVCYNDVVSSCKHTVNGDADLLPNCNARYSGFNHALTDLQRYINKEISYSYDYLLMATHFGNYQKNRAGFEKVFRTLSDTAWENAIDMIKYITKRGGEMDFSQRSGAVKTVKSDLGELASLAKALDSEKKLAEDIHNIHKRVTRLREELHDPEVGSYLEEKFAHKQAKVIRELSGHTNDLKQLLQNPVDSSLSLYLFDEYLQKA